VAALAAVVGPAHIADDKLNFEKWEHQLTLMVNRAEDGPKLKRKAPPAANPQVLASTCAPTAPPSHHAHTGRAPRDANVAAAVLPFDPQQHCCSHAHERLHTHARTHAHTHTHSHSHSHSHTSHISCIDAPLARHCSSMLHGASCFVLRVAGPHLEPACPPQAPSVAPTSPGPQQARAHCRHRADRQRTGSADCGFRATHCARAR
jgi:hypothetical protein